MWVDAYGIHIWIFYIRFYGLILMAGAVAATYLAASEARRRGKDTEQVWDALIWVLIGGIVGARLWHILTPSPSDQAAGMTTLHYLTHPLDMINTTKGGLGIFGAILGGGLALYWFARRRKLRFLEWVDIAAPAVALGQVIGRWGNFVNQELYGHPCDLPWCVSIRPENRLAGFEQFTHFQPLFLYESLWNLANMGLLLYLGRRYWRRLKPGDLFLTYLLVYPLGRFIFEFMRLDSSEIAGINANQALALVVALVAGVLLYLRHRNDRPVTEHEAVPPAPTQEAGE